MKRSLRYLPLLLIFFLAQSCIQIGDRCRYATSSGFMGTLRNHTEHRWKRLVLF
jgi:hypothetical protein